MRPLSFVCLSVGLSPTIGLAQTTVDFQVDDARAQQFGVDPTAAEQELSQTLTQALQLGDPEQFMVSMAEAAAIAGKGLGVDYASNPSKFVFGISIGTGANANGLVLDRDPQSLPAAGFSAQTSAMVGVNLGLLAGTAADPDMALWDRFTVSVHGMSFTSPAADRGFRGFMTNYGGHVTIKLIGKGESGIWDWGGLDVTTGYEHATYRLDFTGNTPFSAGEDLKWDATGRYVLTSTSDSIPVELSSNVRLSVVTLFAGAGLDLNVAQTTGEGSITGPISVETAGGDEAIGTGTISNLASGDALPMAIRGFGGLQVNIMPLKLYAGVQGSSRASASFQAGIRIAQ